MSETEEISSFSQLGLNETLIEACTAIGWDKPTKIQSAVLPPALEGKDIIGLAETGSGKTGAFALPIMQNLLANPQRLYALVLTPTRELAYQIAEQFEALGASIGLKCCVIVGGVDNVTQALALSKKPHIIIATPGRFVDHLENTKGFNIKTIKYLVLDEADRILNMDFEEEVNKILAVCPSDRITYLFSATMTKKVQKLQRASLRSPVKIEMSTKYTTVNTLQQFYLFVPQKYKLTYLVYILSELTGNSFMIFCNTCMTVQKVSLMLKKLDFKSVALHGQLDQNKRLASLSRFKNLKNDVLVATDVASRGLDIPHVDVVINLDVPTQSKEYIHRVGRTARAGRSGRSITIVTQYDIEFYQRIEKLIDKTLPEYPTVKNNVMLLFDNVTDAERLAKLDLKDITSGQSDNLIHLNKSDDDDIDVDEIKLPTRKTFKKNFSKSGMRKRRKMNAK